MQSLNVSSGYPAGGRFIWEFPDEGSAQSFFNCTPKDALLTLQKWGCSEAVARYPGESLIIPLATIELFASAEPLKPVVELFFADCSLPATVLRVAAEQMEHGGRWGIVRLSDQRQVVMASGMQSVLLAGVNLPETTNWRRPEFWEQSDLTEFDRDWRRHLGDDRVMERTYRIRRPGTTDPWQHYTSSFKLLTGEDGLHYHLGVFLERD